MYVNIYQILVTSDQHCMHVIIRGTRDELSLTIVVSEYTYTSCIMFTLLQFPHNHCYFVFTTASITPSLRPTPRGLNTWPLYEQKPLAGQWAMTRCDALPPGGRCEGHSSAPTDRCDLGLCVCACACVRMCMHMYCYV